MTDTKATVLALYEAMNTRNLDTLDAVVDRDVTIHGMAPGLEGVKQSCQMFLDAFGDLRLVVEAIVAEGELVAASVVGRGTHTAPLGDLPATGRSVEVRQHDILRIRDGRIVEGWTVYDQFGLLSQLGVIPAAQPA